ncbi:hypothetical protein VOLCADRAFT_107837 [Volvox carteri f. nagariensis]|uniref:FAS1 domain-containing protein n=1 Tax=Volvox carteri f. nagariensis TaxID=3068 RepID=D8UGS0_VOLCA|nr:uncharacterized protein VOLCADRAFT_107837 [Volvox carteri f. nagariensis]EFJ41099.1 hypothetical protein VOLCADRAFT_107837 [Volvox carteri f. nagariensis]|eukprot:XP_002957862.1 hypothetical protein VOLCADRAFT_107837 [Volvox carteri f. nagariensis]
MQKGKISTLFIVAVVFVQVWSIPCDAARSLTAAPSNVTVYKTLYDLMSATPELRPMLGVFNYTGLLGVLKDPNTMITCFLPSSEVYNVDEWYSWDSWFTPGDYKGRYLWTVLLQHCADGQTALTLNKLVPNRFDDYTFNPDIEYYAAFPKTYKTIFSIRKSNGSTYFYGEEGLPGKIIKADLKGGKSIIHVIDNGNQYPSMEPGYAYENVIAFVSDFGPTASEVFSASTLAPLLLAEPEGRTTQLTIFAPSDSAFASLLSQLGITKTALLSNTRLVDLLTKAHIINGSALYTGSFINYGAPIRLETMAGPLNATADLTIFPKRPSSGPAKMVILSNKYVKAVLSDYNIGGNDAFDPPNFVGHLVDKVLLPVSITELKKLAKAKL